MATSKGKAHFPCPVERVWQTVTDLAHTSKRWWMRPFVPGYLKRQQKRYLEDLRKKLLK